MSASHISNPHRVAASSHPPHRRPATIAELAEKAREEIWDPNKHLKYWLRTAELSRKYGKQYEEAGDFERSFVQLARAATIILEKMPTHKDYQTLLNGSQRHNLTLHGQETLDSLSKLKPGLVEQYERWVARFPELASDPAIKPSVLLEPPTPSHTPDGSRGREYAHRREEVKKEESRRRETEDRRHYDEKYRTSGSSRSSQEDRPKYRIDERRIPEQQVFVHRQQDNEPPAEFARHEIANLPHVLPAPVSASSQQNHTYSQPPIPMSQPQPSSLLYAHPDHDQPVRRYEDSGTAALSTKQSFPGPNNYTIRPTASHESRSQDFSKLVPNRYPQPPAITTTSMAPPSMGSVRYPSLMSQHQMKQGYVPSLHSMFQPPPAEAIPIAPSSLLFQNEPQASNLYANSLPQPFVPVNYPIQRRQHSPIPPLPTVTYQQQSSSHSTNNHRIIPASSGDLISKDLKTIYLPRESLPRFLNVAAINTARNRETCGLLLGKDKRSRFVVTTLLIPKQHSTSDTCTMDEEELVMSFTEERSLITLGWIHTHPTQSCFMSSVDLHTHSGFQRMLPESFAVVCAPSSTPSFGIFRLTDPPGLQTILDCTAKEAFHPHPSVPIYTDADKGHVQIKDGLSLEIVDLRDS